MRCLSTEAAFDIIWPPLGDGKRPTNTVADKGCPLCFANSNPLTRAIPAERSVAICRRQATSCPHPIR